MAYPQAEDGGTASNMEGTCEYIEEAVADIQQRVVHHLGGLGEVLTTPHHKNVLCYESFTKIALDMD
jgi:UDP:flavonoid glycosyltransferase YjiC (YdhE family)